MFLGPLRELKLLFLSLNQCKFAQIIGTDCLFIKQK
nr:MAG TPA: hypothetical protein [Caudoviricetes sp.]